MNFGHYFNQNVDNLPPKLTHLIFGSAFNQIVNNLPQNLTSLTFCEYSEFNRKINKLPKKLKKISIPFDYRYIDDIQADFPEIKVKIL